MITRIINYILGYTGCRLIRYQRSNFETLKHGERYVEKFVSVEGKSFVISDTVSFYKSYREIFIDHIYQFVTEKRYPRIIDCGSNHGLSVLYLKKLYPEARITGVEADPAIFEKLTINLRKHNFADVELVNKAVCNQDGTVDFFTEGADSGRIGHAPSGGGKVSVETISLDELIGEQVDFLKMDIEGAEIDVICSSQKLDLVDRLFVEYHSFTGKEQELGRLLEKLRLSGFRYYIQEQYCAQNPLVRAGNHLGMDLQLNIFAIREGMNHSSRKLHT